MIQIDKNIFVDKDAIVGFKIEKTSVKDTSKFMKDRFFDRLFSSNNYITKYCAILYAKTSNTAFVTKKFNSREECISWLKSIGIKVEMVKE